MASLLTPAGGAAYAGDYDDCLSGDTLVYRWALGQYSTYTQVDMCRRASDGAVYARFSLDTAGWAGQGLQVNLDFKSKTSSNIYTYYCSVGPQTSRMCQSGYWNWTKYEWVHPGLFSNWDGTWLLEEWGETWNFRGMSRPVA